MRSFLRHLANHIGIAYLVLFLSAATCQHPEPPGPPSSPSLCTLDDFNFDYVRGNNLTSDGSTIVTADLAYPKYDYSTLDGSGRQISGRQRINLVFVTMAEDNAKFSAWTDFRGSEIVTGIVDKFRNEKLETGLLTRQWKYYGLRNRSETYDVNVTTELIAPPSDANVRSKKAGISLDVPYFNSASDALDYTEGALIKNQNPAPSSVQDLDPMSWTVYIYLSPTEEFGNISAMAQTAKFASGTECYQTEALSMGHAIIYLGSIKRIVTTAYNNFKNNPSGDENGDPVGSFPSFGGDDNIRKQALINYAWLAIKHEALGHGFSRKWIFITDQTKTDLRGATYHCNTKDCLMNSTWESIGYTAKLPDGRNVAALRLSQTDVETITLKNETGAGHFCEFHQSVGNVVYHDQAIKFIPGRR